MLLMLAFGYYLSYNVFQKEVLQRDMMIDQLDKAYVREFSKPFLADPVPTK